MFNPFEEKREELETDLFLIKRILDGSSEDLENLILRHQAWIYNIARKMVLDPNDAEDVTQEILIKLVTKLATYDARKSSFRTWLYRIVANHVINLKKQKSEYLFPSFEECAAAMEKIPDETTDASPEKRMLLEELKIKCLTGLLLCLDRRQRLVFILSEIFEVDSRTGSEITELSEANYRRILSRAKKRLNNFINQKCGLVKAENPCHCRKKLRGLIREGFVDPDNLLFYEDKLVSIQETIRHHRHTLNELTTPENVKLFREHPFYTSPDFNNRIRRIMTGDTSQDPDDHQLKQVPVKQLPVI